MPVFYDMLYLGRAIYVRAPLVQLEEIYKDYAISPVDLLDLGLLENVPRPGSQEVEPHLILRAIRRNMLEHNGERKRRPRAFENRD